LKRRFFTMSVGSVPYTIGQWYVLRLRALVAKSEIPLRDGGYPGKLTKRSIYSLYLACVDHGMKKQADEVVSKLADRRN
jgi:hypothetical protein